MGEALHFAFFAHFRRLGTFPRLVYGWLLLFACTYYATARQRAGNFCELLHCKITVKPLQIYNAPHCKFTMRISILQCVYNAFTTFYSVYTVKYYSLATVILQWLYNDAAPPTPL